MCLRDDSPLLFTHIGQAAPEGKTHFRFSLLVNEI